MALLAGPTRADVRPFEATFSVNYHGFDAGTSVFQLKRSDDGGLEYVSRANAQGLFRLFLSGQKDEAAGLIPDELVHALHIIGDEQHVKAKIKEWEASGVTTLVLSCRSTEEIADVARVVLD